MPDRAEGVQKGWQMHSNGGKGVPIRAEWVQRGWQVHSGGVIGGPARASGVQREQHLMINIYHGQRGVLSLAFRECMECSGRDSRPVRVHLR